MRISAGQVALWKHSQDRYRLFRLFALVTGLLLGALVHAAPGVPEVAWMVDHIALTNGNASATVPWNMWYGANGDHWKLVQDGVVMNEAALVPASPAAQSGAYTLTYHADGLHSVTIRLCTGSGNSEVCSESAPKLLYIGDAVIDATGWPQPLQEQNAPYANTSGKKLGAYFVEWGIYGRGFPISRIPSTNLTHINYAFIAVCGPNDTLAQENPSGYQVLLNDCSSVPDYSVVVFDRWAALDKPFPGDSNTDSLKGNFGQLRRLHLAQPDLNIVASIGGWTLSDPFYYLANDPARRAIFVASVRAFLVKYPFFTGIDLDWEHPGGNGANPTLGTPQDAAGFRALVFELRAMLDTLGGQANPIRRFSMSAAISANPTTIDQMGWAQTHAALDYLDIMSYDFYGAWNGQLGHMAGLYSVPGELEAGFSGDAAVQRLVDAGIPAEKLVLGVAMYGRGWTGITGVTGGNAMTGTGNGPFPLGTEANGKWEDGVIDYRAIEIDYRGGPTGTGIYGFQVVYDTTAEQPYVWNPSSASLISFEDPRSARAKGQYVVQHGLGGLFGWEIDADNGRLLNAMHEGLGDTPGTDHIFKYGFEASP